MSNIGTIQGIDTLTADQKLLVEKAKEAVFTSYSPYSGFKVGAAVMMSDNRIYTGSNQENIAYGECICAERVTLLYATANNPETAPKAIAIAAYTGNDYVTAPVTPCGSCRQVLCEMEMRYGSDIEVIMYGTSGCVIAPNAKSLLPLSFDSLK